MMLRIVYDASCKSTGGSLNDCLHTGPALSQGIMDVNLCFQHKKALGGDIQKAFLNLSIAEDSDILRFLWFDDVKKESLRVIILRFTRVVFGVLHQVRSYSVPLSDTMWKGMKKRILNLFRHF